jgi:hypothetical protein
MLTSNHLGRGKDPVVVLGSTMSFVAVNIDSAGIVRRGISRRTRNRSPVATSHAGLLLRKRDNLLG